MLSHFILTNIDSIGRVIFEDVIDIGPLIMKLVLKGCVINFTRDMVPIDVQHQTVQSILGKKNSITCTTEFGFVVRTVTEFSV